MFWSKKDTSKGKNVRKSDVSENRKFIMVDFDEMEFMKCIGSKRDEMYKC